MGDSDNGSSTTGGKNKQFYQTTKQHLFCVYSALPVYRYLDDAAPFLGAGTE